jgi:hypothetical protein
LALLLCATPAVALAQTTGNAGDSGTGSSTSPAEDQGPAVPAPVEATTIPAPPGVVVNTLGSIDGPAVGLLEDTTGGLGTQMWSGASRAELEEELARIPVVTTNRTVRELSRRILLTAAETPVGPGKRPLIAIRLERLLDAGFIDEAGTLAAKAELPNNDEFARVQAEALLYAQRDSDLCSDKTAARLSSAEPFWLQLRAYCYEIGGDAAAADLTRSVMSAQGDNDPILDATLAGDAKGVQAADVTRPTAVDIYLLRKAGGTVTAELAAPLGTPANLLATRDAHNSPADRLAAAERIVSTGALAPDELRAIADVQAQDSETAGDTSFLAVQSALRRKASLESTPDGKLALAVQADAMSAPYPVFAALQSDTISSMPAEPASGKSAILAWRVLLSDGKPDAAAPWIGPPDSPETAQAGIALDLVAPTPERDARAQDDIAWFVAHATPETGTPAAAALAIGMWQALGRTLTPDAVGLDAALSTQAFAGFELPAELFRRIDAAAAASDRRGEAALLVVDALGAGSIARLAPDSSAHLVATLERIGLDQEARSLAAEALLFGPPNEPMPPPRLVPAQAAQ